MGKPKYACEECGRDYQSKAAADRHIRDKHDGNAKRIPYAQLVADVGKGRRLEHIIGGLPSRVRRPDLGYVILEELCREGARMIGKRNFEDALDNYEQGRPDGKALLRDFSVLKHLITTLSGSRALENFHYSTLEDLINDQIRGEEREAYLEKAIRSDELKSRAAKKRIIKEQLDGANGPQRRGEEMTQLELLTWSNECRRKELARKPDTE